MEPIVAAIDLGTSKMIAMVARKQLNGGLSILYTEKEKSDNSIKRGYVFNVEMTKTKVSGLIRKLNAHLKIPLKDSLKKIYVGIGGQSLRTELYSVKKTVEGGVVTQDILNSLKGEVVAYKPEFFTILDILEPEYYLDGLPEARPKGATAYEIEARFLLIVGNFSLKLNQEKVFKNLITPHFIISPLATAEAVLKKNEKELGCVLVEMVAGITYVSVYKNG